MRDVLDPPVSEFSLSLYGHPFLYTLFSSPFTLIINNIIYFRLFGDHLQTCRVKSPTQVHDWVVYRLGGILGSVGHRVKIHKITPATGKERGDLEIKDYVNE